MPDAEKDFVSRLNHLGSVLLTTLAAFEFARRQLHPPRIGSLREALEPLYARLSKALFEFRAEPVPERAQALAAQFTNAAACAEGALRDFCEPAAAEESIQRILGSMHQHCQAQALLYPLRKALPPISDYFLEAPYRDRTAILDPDTPAGEVGVFHFRNPSGQRGGFWLYVPESYDGQPWPLVVALHGGSGTGEDFLWSWLTEARGRRFLLMAPTSLGPTWSLMGPDIDAEALRIMVDHVKKRWSVDARRVLLTGLSDGATYTLIAGLRSDTHFTALAPVSGVLHPMALANTPGGARGRRIYLVHGALDWMFPIAVARMAHDKLARAGADITFSEIADLSHTYPRDENDRILTWFDPSLALPG